MNYQKIKLLMALSLCAGVGAVLCAIASGSHFHFSISNGSWNYDFRVGADSNLASGVLGFGAMVLFLAGLGLHLSQGGRGGQGDEASPFAWFSDFAGSGSGSGSGFGFGSGFGTGWEVVNG